MWHFCVYVRTFHLRLWIFNIILVSSFKFTSMIVLIKSRLSIRSLLVVIYSLVGSPLRTSTWDMYVTSLLSLRHSRRYVTSVNDQLNAHTAASPIPHSLFFLPTYCCYVKCTAWYTAWNRHWLLKIANVCLRKNVFRNKIDNHSSPIHLYPAFFVLPP